MLIDSIAVLGYLFAWMPMPMFIGCFSLFAVLALVFLIRFVAAIWDFLPFT